MLTVVVVVAGVEVGAGDSSVGGGGAATSRWAGGRGGNSVFKFGPGTKVVVGLFA